MATESAPVGTVRVSKHIITEEKRSPCNCAAKNSASNTNPSPPPSTPATMRPTNSAPGEDVVIVLHAEQANVTTEIVPIERVTVHTDVLTEQQSLWGTVSHEEITINDDTHTTQLK